MSKLVITSIGPASSVQDGGRPGSQRYGLVPSGAMDRLALAAANTLLGNETLRGGHRSRPVRAKLTARGGAVRVALAGASRNADIDGRAVAPDISATLAEGETLTLGFARSGSFSYLAIEGGIEGEPMFGSLSGQRPRRPRQPLSASAAGRRRIAGDRRPATRRSGGSTCPRSDRGADPRRAGAAGRRIRRRGQNTVRRQRMEDLRHQRPHGLSARRPCARSICTATTSSPTAPSTAACRCPATASRSC